MTHPTLPPLPEPDTRYFCNKCGQFSDTQTHHRPHGPQCNYLGVAFKVSSFSRAEVESIRIATLEWAAQQVPSNWLDPLLTGPEGMGPSPWNCPEVERLLSGIATAIRAAKKESKHG